MSILRLFITTNPIRKFFFDLFCAAIIRLVDLAFPQILRQLTNTLFTQSKEMILHALPFLAILF